jgi:hypothetical protein
MLNVPVYMFIGKVKLKNIFIIIGEIYKNAIYSLG